MNSNSTYRFISTLAVLFSFYGAEAQTAPALPKLVVNVVIDEDKKTVAAFAGDFQKAHEAGVAFLRQYCEVAAIPGDIVITMGAGDIFRAGEALLEEK